MATLRQYFETDFGNTIKVYFAVPYRGELLEAALLCDVHAYATFPALYVPDGERDLAYFVGLVRLLAAQTQFNFNARIGLPSTRTFPGLLRLTNGPGPLVEYKMFGDVAFRSALETPQSGRIFLYSDSNLSPSDIARLQEESEQFGRHVQFRGSEHLKERTRLETPLAFISHDSRDKDEVARPIAVALQRLLCPVWYDEYSLKVGDRLRESVEKGLKDCKRCVLVLSKNFISNSGWTRTEFDSIFTRELLEGTDLVLPVWHGVTKQDVYEYSPSLANRVALKWQELGEDEVCRRLHRVLVT